MLNKIEKIKNAMRIQCIYEKKKCLMILNQSDIKEIIQLKKI